MTSIFGTRFTTRGAVAAPAQIDAPRPQAYKLSDRFELDEGTVFLSGTQALARFPYEQLRRDRAAGLNTAAFVSGYPGSPLSGYDAEASAAAALAAAAGLRIVVQPGLNEELAATSVMGSQLGATMSTFRYDGVVGVWYGKAPGLDRASDALRHAVFAGTSPRGGAVALVGDDPSAKSSSIPSSSDLALADLMMPVLYPGDVQEALDLARHAVAMSRATGLWTAIKVVEAVADGSGTVQIAPEAFAPQVPQMEYQGKPFVPKPTGFLLSARSLEIEREMRLVRWELARRYGAANRLNSVAVRGPSDWIGIVAAGHTFHETREALAVLGLRTDDEIRSAGIRLLRLGLPMPVDQELIRGFADGLAEVFVVEEKSSSLEAQVRDALYDLTQRPRVVGRRQPDGSALIPATGTLSADVIASHMRTRLLQRIAPEALRAPAAPSRTRIPLSVSRTPFFCSGCPHNSSTRVPDGTLVGAGIGCHTMVLLMEPEQVGEVLGLTSMGNEGAQWLGIAPFVDTPHLVQNIGDGTLFHSGMMAVRAAVASGVNITYKILYNGTIAMTGGQSPAGQLSVPTLAHVLSREGIARIIVTTEDLERYHDADLPKGVEVWDRSRVVEAQAVLAAVPGTTVLIHDQRCAAELRRDRKRGRAAPPTTRILIDERVCEGCGDCGEKSNCLSVQPVDTPFGRKTRIDQTSCNLDYSCVKGDCPSFVSVLPARRRRRAGARRVGAVDVSALPDPRPRAGDRTLRLSGIGGTGVVTVSQIIGTAAMLEGLHVRGLDQTGLSQKAGPVVSDLRLSRGEPSPSNRATVGSVDTLLAFDLLVAVGDSQLDGSSRDRTVVVGSVSETPTGSMVRHPSLELPRDEMMNRLAARTSTQHYVDAAAEVTAHLGDATTANVYLLGYALQLGEIPLRHDSVERAIGLNGVAVDKNIAAFRLGRLRAGITTTAANTGPEPTDELVERLATDLSHYQSRRYADRYRKVVASTEATGSDALRRAVAVNLHKLMAYKDEYEVARLMLRPEARAAIEAVGGRGARARFNLHPPLLRAIGLRDKISLGRTARPMFRLLRAMRRVRGTPLDLFGWASMRRLERAMIPEYIDAVGVLVGQFAYRDEAELVAIAELPDAVRGYEDVKRPRAEAYRSELTSRIAALKG